MKNLLLLFSIVFCLPYSGFSQCNYLTLNDLVSFYKLNLEDREDLLIEKKFEYLEIRDGLKLFGKCKNYLKGEGEYQQYLLSGEDLLQYTTSSSETYI